MFGGPLRDEEAFLIVIQVRAGAEKKG